MMGARSYLRDKRKRSKEGVLKDILEAHINHVKDPQYRDQLIKELLPESDKTVG